MILSKNFCSRKRRFEPHLPGTILNVKLDWNKVVQRWEKYKMTNDRYFWIFCNSAKFLFLFRIGKKSWSELQIAFHNKIWKFFVGVLLVNQPKKVGVFRRQTEQNTKLPSNQKRILNGSKTFCYTNENDFLSIKKILICNCMGNQWNLSPKRIWYDHNDNQQLMPLIQRVFVNSKFGLFQKVKYFSDLL